MERITTLAGITVSYDRYGSGPPLVLVHGAFSDHITNWEFVKTLFEKQFTVHAIARRGRGETDATEGHSVEDEMEDVAAVVREVGERAFMLGHSYGAVCALGAAARVPENVRKLVLYEHPGPGVIHRKQVAQLEKIAESGDLDKMVETVMRDILQVPQQEIDEIKTTPFWATWTDDAIPTLNDVRALVDYQFDAEKFRSIAMPVLLQIGTESPREIYATDALATVLPDVRIGELEGQAHDGMTTAPEMYAEAVTKFLME
jgi:pimeloyl-ACP methyl ester carboxylesterase